VKILFTICGGMTVFTMCIIFDPTFKKWHIKPSDLQVHAFGARINSTAGCLGIQANTHTHP